MPPASIMIIPISGTSCHIGYFLLGPHILDQTPWSFQPVASHPMANWAYVSRTTHSWPNTMRWRMWSVPCRPDRTFANSLSSKWLKCVNTVWDSRAMGSTPHQSTSEAVSSWHGLLDQASLTRVSRKVFWESKSSQCSNDHITHQALTGLYNYVVANTIFPRHWCSGQGYLLFYFILWGWADSKAKWSEENPALREIWTSNHPAGRGLC